MERNFNKIYEKVYKSGGIELTNMRKKRNMGVVIFLIITTLIIVGFETFLISDSFLIVVPVFGAFASLIYLIIVSNKYKKIYKRTIIRGLVYAYNPDMLFNEYAGVNRREYDIARFDGRYDRFYSEDLIEGNILENTHLKMSQVRTIREEYERDKDGNLRKRDVTVFAGLFGMVNLGFRQLSELEISSNNLFGRFNKDRIEVDSAQFEKQYDLYSIDKVRAMEVFTSELIEKINKFKEETGYIIEIKILNNQLFFRIPCGEVFEAPLIKSEVDYNTLYKYFKMIDSPIDIITKIIENAEYTIK